MSDDCSERDGEPTPMAEQQEAVDRDVPDVLELTEQPAPRLFGTLEIGNPQRDVVQHRARLRPLQRSNDWNRPTR